MIQRLLPGWRSKTCSPASVILLDPDAHQLARWMVHACIAVNGQATDCFRDGVTVKISGVDHRSEQQPTPAQIEKSLTASIGDVTWVGKFARIQSATREQYKAAGGKENVDGTNWLNVSRTL